MMTDEEYVANLEIMIGDDDQALGVEEIHRFRPSISGNGPGLEVKIKGETFLVLVQKVSA